MKKILLYIVALTITTSAWAQIPNASFENWGKYSFSAIDHWIAFGPASLTTKANQGNSAMFMEHIAYSGQQATIGYTAGAAGGGWPYVGRPDTLSFYAKGYFATDDSCQVIVSGGKSGSQIAFAFANFSVSDSTNFTLIKIPITFFLPIAKLDTIAIIMSLGSIDSSNSWVIIDDVSLTKNGTKEGTIINPGFETLNTTNMDEPTDWSTSSIFSQFIGMPVMTTEKTSDAKDGSFALKLTNRSYTGSGTLPGVAFSGKTDLNSSTDDYPTFPINKKYLNLTGYYKYAPKNGDTCKFVIAVYKGGANVGQGEFRSTANVSTYSAFNSIIKYDIGFAGIPDSASIILFAGAEDGDPQDGSVLYIDKLELNDVNAINTVDNNIQMQVFPNPANDIIIIDVNSMNSGNMIIQLLDISGKQIKELYNNKIGSGYTKVQCNVVDIPAGIYIVKTTNNNTAQITKLQIVKW
ncbi:MAG: T9SS type A sorting domain-containing protein [Bacteroidota bacterium]|nr:T9SS type A sorting domain-containing protein [Bacteroidota bacterium]